MPSSSFDVLGLEPEDFAGAEAGPDAGEQAEGEERHRSRMIRFDKRHHFLRLRGGEGRRAAAPPANPMGRDFGKRVFRNPVALQRELEEGEETMPRRLL